MKSALRRTAPADGQMDPDLGESETHESAGRGRPALRFRGELLYQIQELLSYLLPVHQHNKRIRDHLRPLPGLARGGCRRWLEVGGDGDKVVVFSSTVIVRAPRLVGTVAATLKLSGESAFTTVMLPSPFEL